MKICNECKLLPTEFWTHKRKIKPNRESCSDCVRFKKLFEDKDYCQKLDEKREGREKRKREFEIYKQQSSANIEIQEALKVNEDNRRKNYRIVGANNRAVRKKAFLDLTEEEKKEIKKFYQECPKGFHVDHIIPICKGGKHCMANLQYLTAAENSAKGSNVDKKSIIKKLSAGENVSISWLMRKFKITKENAESIISSLEVYAPST